MWNRFACQMCVSSHTFLRLRRWYSANKFCGFRRYLRDGRFVCDGAPLLFICAMCARRYFRGSRFGLWDIARRRICFGNFWNTNFVLDGFSTASVNALISFICECPYRNVITSGSSVTLPPIAASYSILSVIFTVSSSIVVVAVVVVVLVWSLLISFLSIIFAHRKSRMANEELESTTFIAHTYTHTQQCTRLHGASIGIKFG